MNYFGKAEQTAKTIIKAFESGNIPAALSSLYIEDAVNKHCASYSMLNRLVVALNGFSDAMGFKQWKKYDRTVKKGEKALYILAPVLKTIKDETVMGEDGKPKKRQICVGFKGVPVFGLEQTEGKPMEHGENTQQFLNELPLKEVAEKWGLSVNAYNGQEGSAKGLYVPNNAIALGVTDLATWTHELAHAADDRNGTIGSTKKQDRALAEVVAEMAGAVLLECIGKPVEADRGGAFEYITHWANEVNMKPVDACRKVLTRVVNAVNLILEEAGIKEEEKAA